MSQVPMIAPVGCRKKSKIVLRAPHFIQFLDDCVAFRMMFSRVFFVTFVLHEVTESCGPLNRDLALTEHEEANSGPAPVSTRTTQGVTPFPIRSRSESEGLLC